MDVMAVSAEVGAGPFTTGAVWIAIGIIYAFREYLGYRRRVTTTARCTGLRKVDKRTVQYDLSRPSARGGAKRRVTLKAKKGEVRKGETVTITYDPKDPHKVYLLGEHRKEPWRVAGLICGIGMVPILLGILLP